LFSPDSRRVIASASDNILRVWDRDTGKLVSELKPERVGRQPWPLTFAADGRSVAWFDGDLCIREIAGGGERFHVSAPGMVTALACSPDGRFLACGQADGRLVVHSIGTGKQRVQRQGRQGPLYALAFSRDGRQLASGSENGTILIWKVPESDDLPATLTAKEAESFWQALISPDAARANRALAALATAPAQAVPLIQQRFRDDSRAIRERLKRLVANLDDDSFKVREEATRALAEIGPDAADALRAALAKSPSLEAKRRMEDLLGRLKKGDNPERRRCLRALEVLERIGTPQAKDVLRELARKELPTELADEVQASLRRMNQ
jgi:hypothetical protein